MKSLQLILLCFVLPCPSTSAWAMVPFLAKLCRYVHTNNNTIVLQSTVWEPQVPSGRDVVAPARYHRPFELWNSPPPPTTDDQIQRAWAIDDQTTKNRNKNRNWQKFPLVSSGLSPQNKFPGCYCDKNSENTELRVFIQSKTGSAAGSAHNRREKASFCSVVPPVLEMPGLRVKHAL
jgi:hypothetical protein